MNDQIYKVLVPLIYGMSSILYVVNFAEKKKGVGRFATGLLYVGWAVHITFLAIRALGSGHIPFASLGEALSICALMVCSVYMYLEFSSKDRSLGAFLIPVATLIQTAGSVMIKGVAPLPENLSSGWFETHVSASLVAYTAFAISCMSSIMYIFLFDEIHAKHLGFFYKRLPPLATLDHINYRAAMTGFWFMTLGIMSGSLWASSAWEGFWQWDIKLISSFAIWILYGVHLFGRMTAGWQGKRAAHLSIAGFVLVLFTFSVTSILPVGKHVF